MESEPINALQTAQEHDMVRAAKPRKYAFFSFCTSIRFASEYGQCSGQVDLRTGEILANISYGLLYHRDTYRLNMSGPVSAFPHTIEDQIIHAARKAVRNGGYKMTRRRVVFICKDGRRYITEEFNGDKSEAEARSGCLDSCDLDWSEIRAIFQQAGTYTQFIKANLKAQAAYHSFLGDDGNSGIVRNLRKGREMPDADSILFIFEQRFPTGGRAFETEYNCFTPRLDSPCPACLGTGKERCRACALHYINTDAEKGKETAEA